MRSRFLPPYDTLHVSLIGEQKGGSLWRLERVLIFYSESLDAEIRVPMGFITDFSSVPRLPFMYWWFGNRASRPGVIHDWLYEKAKVQGRPITRSQADEVWREACDADGQDYLSSRSMWAGIRAGGWWAWRDHRKRNGYEPRFPDTP